MLPPPPDARALKVLFDTYWSLEGWRECVSPSSRLPSPSESDIRYAKAAGVMFDPITLSHDQKVDRAVAAARLCRRESVANAFLTSLTSRRLELRSALGSFAVLRYFGRHEFVGFNGFDRICRFCHEWHADSEVDLSVFNFERYKWGGVRRDDIFYSAFDLECFSLLPESTPSDDDLRVMRTLLDAMRSAPAETTAPALHRRLAPVLKSNKAERDVLIGILGVCGILETRAYRGYRDRFVPYEDRELPPYRYVEMVYPACWWRGSDGVNEEAVDYWFGHVL